MLSEINAEELVRMSSLLFGEIEIMPSSTFHLELTFRHVQESSSMHFVFIGHIHLLPA